MNSISVFQVGDIHYPESASELLADVKDRGIGTIASGSAPNPLQVVIRQISKEISSKNPASLLICGDLTSRGNLSSYQECVDYLVDSLDLSGANKDKFHVVPGNHDVDRALCPDRTKLNLNKFKPLSDAWSAVGTDVLLSLIHI